MLRKLIFLLLLLPLGAQAQNKLKIEIRGVKTSDGMISVAIYDREEDFLKFDRVYKSDSTKAKAGTTWIEIDDLPSGEYALAIFHDENANAQLDTNWMGVPKEAFGFSKSGMKLFGPPSFKDCVMRIETDEEIAISL